MIKNALALVQARVNNQPTRLVATTVDGRQVWARAFTGNTLRHVAADNLGGVVLLLHHAYSAPTPLPERIQRLDGVTGQVTWEYLARDDGELSEVAIHPNGTVYVTEEDYFSPNTWLAALDEFRNWLRLGSPPPPCGLRRDISP